MTNDYRQWAFTDAERQKFDSWIQRIMYVHSGTNDVRNQSVNWTPLGKPLSECVVSLFTTGGVHLRTDTPFDIDDSHGDWTYRNIPTDIDTRELEVTHSHYSHVDADRDVNCMFPLDRLRELRDEGIIGDIAPMAFSIMGFNPDPENLMAKTAPVLAEGFQESGADLVFMTCG